MCTHGVPIVTLECESVMFIWSGYGVVCHPLSCSNRL